MAKNHDEARRRRIMFQLEQIGQRLSWITAHRAANDEDKAQAGTCLRLLNHAYGELEEHFEADNRLISRLVKGR